jgi:hypothetical protein
MKVRTVGVGAPVLVENERKWAYTYYIDGHLIMEARDLSDNANAAKQKMREKVATLRRQNGLTWRHA